MLPAPGLCGHRRGGPWAVMSLRMLCQEGKERRDWASCSLTPPGIQAGSRERALDQEA